MYCHIIASTNWTWEYIDDHMTVPRLRAMTEYWKSSPPVHLMVASYFGIGAKPKQPSEADMAELFAAIPMAQYQAPR